MAFAGSFGVSGFGVSSSLLKDSNRLCHKGSARVRAYRAFELHEASCGVHLKGSVSGFLSEGA